MVQGREGLGDGLAEARLGGLPVMAFPSILQAQMIHCFFKKS